MILDRLSKSLFLIEENYFKNAMSVLDKRKLDNYKLSQEDKEKIEEDLGFEMNNSNNDSFSKGKTAFIPITGAIVQHGDMFSEVSGLTSTDRITKDLKRALANDEVGDIVFLIDSPGGEAHGISELGDLIFNSRGEKKITAYISGLGCSAAYWIASQCDEIVCSDTAELGSIGVMVTWMDDSEAMKKAGYKERKFISSYSKNKNKDLKTPAGEEALMKRIDDFCLVFIDKVARGRSLTTKDVQVGFGEGSVYLGQECVTRKMADRIGSKEEFLNNGEDMSEKKNSAGTRAESGEVIAEKNKEVLEKSKETHDIEGLTASYIPQVSVEEFEKVQKELQLTNQKLSNQAKETEAFKAKLLEKEAIEFQENNKSKFDAKDVDKLGSMFKSLANEPEKLEEFKELIENIPVNSKYKDEIISGKILDDKYGKEDTLTSDELIDAEVDADLKKQGKLKN